MITDLGDVKIFFLGFPDVESPWMPDAGGLIVSGVLISGTFGDLRIFVRN